MIIIKNAADGQYMATHTGRNSRVLSSTETMHRKAAVYRNIRAHMKLYGCREVTVKDMTGEKPITVTLKI